MNIVNLTPYDFVLYSDYGEVLRVIKPEHQPARVSSVTYRIGSVDGIPVNGTDFADVIGLPEPQDGTVYIVSLLVQQAVPSRADVYRPDTEPESVVRDSNGNIIGVKSLAK